MRASAAGEFRRTPRERASQQVSWQRSDQAFFASGACHILAWSCRDAHPQQPIGVAAMRFPAESCAFHVYATWAGWAFDHSGWNPEPELLAVNSAFEGRPVERIEVGLDLASFCAAHDSRMPHQYWRDPWPRARAYVAGYVPPWMDPDVSPPGWRPRSR